MIFDKWEVKVENARPCPFCGCKTIKADKREWVEENHVRGVKISCDECLANVFEYNDDYDYQASFDKALEKWNRRAT